MRPVFRRVWRHGAGQLLALYLILFWVPAIYELVTGGARDTSWRRAVVLFALVLFLAWRTWRGGTISFAVLLLFSGFGLVVDVVATVWPWDASVLLNLVVDVAQLAILLSPAVRHSLGTRAKARSGYSSDK